MRTAEQIINKLKLKRHPKEGGYFAETYRSKFSTAIYYLITPESFSSMHKLDKDEIFHFYCGDPVEMLLLFPDGTGKKLLLGNDIMKMQPQVLVKKGVWQGSRLVKGGKYALLGTTMAPSFEYKDYLNGEKQTLIKKYPKFKTIIKALII